MRKGEWLMRGTRRLVLLLMMVVASVFLASGVALAANQRGGSGNDTINGTADTDTLDGQDGDDTISGSGGPDKLYGAKGNDYLFANNEHQSGVEDGDRVVKDGNDLVSGGDGSDTLVGATGADVLQGGADADTIIEGPVNDAAEDKIYGGAGGDVINVASMPASKDFVDCGLGTDTVEADPLDDVGPSCENVERLDLQPSTGSAQGAAGAQSAAEQLPAVVSTEQIPSTEPSPSLSEEPQGPTTSSDNVSAQGAWTFFCWAAPIYRGSTLCSVADPYVGQWWGVGLDGTNITRWITYEVYMGYVFDDYDWLHEVYDDFDWYERSWTGYPHGIYMRTTCWYNQNCAAWTAVNGYVWYD